MWLRTRAVLTGAAVLAVLIAVPAVPAVMAEPAEGDPPTVTIIASEFAFEAPETMPAGAVTVRMENQGEVSHHAQLIRLDEGKTLEDLQAAAADGTTPEGVTMVGGPGLAAPGMTSQATVDLRPGTYYWLCFVGEGTDPPAPHIEKGMVKKVVVEPGPREPLPTPDNTMLLNDYGFKIGKPLQAGQQVVRVRNTAAQPHEVVIVKLNPDKTMDDLLAWMEAGGEAPPPAMPIGGMQALSQGHAGNLTLDLEPGNYGLICLVPDTGDGQPHFVHGMVDEFTVE